MRELYVYKASWQKFICRMVEIKRKLYKRGSSFETTIPMPLLFAVDKSMKQQIVFKFDEELKQWYIEIKEK